MKYEETLFISKAENRQINRYLKKNATREEDNFNESDSFSITAKFQNGLEMDIKMCGVQFEENGTSNIPWTEAVLFEGSGEVACSEVEDEFTGDWELEHEGNTYITHVKVKE